MSAAQRTATISPEDTMQRKNRTIGVMGSGKEPWLAFSEPLGAWLAQAGFNLLTGGGQGVMLAVARAFAGVPGRAGRSIGILPTQADPLAGYVPLDGYPHPFVDIPILTPLPRREPDADPQTINRNYVNVLSSDLIVALPGGHGTAEEIALAQRWRKPLVCFGPDGAFRALAAGAVCTSSLDDVIRFVEGAFALEQAQALR
ncbi:DNA-binding protein [Burkholderia stabilis]|uniref:SLOG cluster 4 domain-containing protein n=1 Tax=Burkholderia stabilis TaxID=95485 RepID=UPI000851EC09|nr:DNA-binding protein [Burkholderia stabilis]AOR72604.1 DNA-binding protein [Burkholderia stabilis]HDR9489472.1 DNA-binding protein [Burkholderia stabilis]HDR9536289.1 DNA-binding protein [Burkholderia stabilis]HDR9551803.1 DNA-binding protein [Burkholderia stabilis]HDR9559820.1 DNA-binding protein [Burkholderia stabilis]